MKGRGGGTRADVCLVGGEKTVPWPSVSHVKQATGSAEVGRRLPPRLVRRKSPSAHVWSEEGTSGMRNKVESPLSCG